MENKKYFFAIDLGATSGRTIVGSLAEGKIEQEELTRFNNNLIETGGPSGRLDKDTEGFLLITDDGALTYSLMPPDKHVSKTYRVTVNEKVDEETINRLMTGIEIEPGVFTASCVVTVLVEEPERTVLEFVIREGKNRQIRRMCEAVGLEVVRLRRTSIGPVKLGMLKPGAWRELSAEELRALRNAVGKE